MNLTDDLYQEIILDHYRSKKNKLRLEDADLASEGANPSCGDDMELFINLDEEGRVSRAAYDGMGCSICCASANMLCESLPGKTLDEARAIMERFRAMLLESEEPDFPDELGDLEAMQGVRNYPVRIKCALLSWSTLERMLKEREEARA
jgi:nitrogen fixation NifU-like protein